MVSKSDRLSDLFKGRAGLVEAELIPFFEVKDLVILAALTRSIRALFNPRSAHHINFLKVFAEKLEVAPTDNLISKIQDQTDWLAILKIVFEFNTQLRLLPNQSLGHTYTRYDSIYKNKEILSYAGGNESLWSEEN
jgi:hypothetical protein